MEKENPGFYAIIPANVRYDANLIPSAKLLYGEITALTNQKGYCWANDTYFTKLYKVSKKTVQTWLKSLEVNGYISREVVYKEGSNEIVTRYIRLRAYPIHEKVHTPMHEKVRDNNTSFNTTVNNTSNKKNKSETSSLDNDFDEIWELYPKKIARKEALAAYKKAIKSGTDKEKILNGVENYVKHLEANKNWLQAMDGGRWFKKARWTDEYENVIGGASDGRYDDLF